MIPIGLSEVTPAWLSEALGTPVDAIDVVDAHSGTTGRARLRLTGGPATPPHVFVKLAPFDEAQREFIAATGIGRSEARFYGRVGDGLPVRAPHVFHAATDDDGRYVMVLEDLTAAGCTFPTRTDADDPDRARSTVEELAKLHAAFWGTDLSWAPTRAGFGDDPGAVPPEAAAWFVKIAHDRFRDELPPVFAAACRLYIERTADILDLWDEGERTLVHGDCHIGNLFVAEDGRTGFYDWAMFSHSPALRDVAYFPSYSMSPEARAAQDRSLLDHYLATLSGLGVDLDAELAWQQYRMFALFGWVSATSTAAMGTKWQKEELSRGAMERSTQTLADLGTVELTEELLGA